jgi:lipopolysaccharide export LptBFGC system permease protein LptF
MRITFGFFAVIAAMQAHAAVTNPIPEPGAIALLGIGGLVGALVLARKRKNKK